MIDRIVQFTLYYIPSRNFSVALVWPRSGRNKLTMKHLVLSVRRRAARPNFLLALHSPASWNSLHRWGYVFHGESGPDQKISARDVCLSYSWLLRIRNRGNYSWQVNSCTIFVHIIFTLYSSSQLSNVKTFERYSEVLVVVDLVLEIIQLGCFVCISAFVYTSIFTFSIKFI